MGVRRISAILAIGLCFFSSALAQNIDIDLLRDINAKRNRSLDGIMTGITNFDFPVAVAIPATELIIGYHRHDARLISQGWQTVAGYGLNTVLTYGLKYTVRRPRPYTTYPDVDPYQTYSDHSFPSGHASAAFCAATSLGICCPRWYVIVPAYTWASAVAYSRLFLGVHYPSDVLAGAIIGSGSAWLAYKGNQWLQHRSRLRAREPVD